jgi:hypothetical protein
MLYVNFGILTTERLSYPTVNSFILYKQAEKERDANLFPQIFRQDRSQ